MFISTGNIGKMFKSLIKTHPTEFKKRVSRRNVIYKTTCHSKSTLRLRTWRSRSYGLWRRVVRFFWNVEDCLHYTTQFYITEDCSLNKSVKVKGKAVPLQVWSGPQGSRKLKFPDFMTTAQDRGKVVSLTHRPPLPPGNTPGTYFC